jgi:hypothetical protein
MILNMGSDCGDPDHQNSDFSKKAGLRSTSFEVGGKEGSVFKGIEAGPG